eukprot:11520013-Alexandrium_andersonii.AAC.1
MAEYRDEVKSLREMRKEYGVYATEIGFKLYHSLPGTPSYRPANLERERAHGANEVDYDPIEE